MKIKGIKGSVCLPDFFLNIRIKATIPDNTKAIQHTKKVFLKPIAIPNDIINSPSPYPMFSSVKRASKVVAKPGIIPRAKSNKVLSKLLLVISLSNINAAKKTEHNLGDILYVFISLNDAMERYKIIRSLNSISICVLPRIIIIFLSCILHIVHFLLMRYVPI